MSLTVQEAPIHQSHVYGRIKILRTLFEKGHQRNIPVKLFQNLACSFGEDFLRISSCPYIVQEAHIHQSHVYARIKFSRTFFEKGHPRNIPVKLFQNLTSGFREEEEFLHVHIVQEAPIHQRHLYGRIKISRTLFEKGHPRNTPVKLF